MLYIYISKQFKTKMQGIADTGGSTTSQKDKKENSIPKEFFRFIPSINE